MSNNLSITVEEQLADYIAGFYADPLGFVLGVYPWGEPMLPDGSINPLADKVGPEQWQREELVALGEHIKENIVRKMIGLQTVVYRFAMASGHGVGKSAFVAWVVHFLMSTRKDTRMAVTASTQFQLEDKTWPELGKWHNLMLNRHWFHWSATAFSFAPYSEERRKNYRATAATVSEQNTEAFQGLHNEGGTVAVIFDEASGVHSKIWEVSEGALTDGEAFFFAFGNPTKPSGEFADCFNKHTDLYRTRNVDSRDVSFTNKNALADIIYKYGADSDEAKVRVYGEFPSQSYSGFIAAEAVRLAMERPDKGDLGAGLIMAIDVARFGNDKTVFRYRQGRNARVFPTLKFGRLSTTQIVDLATAEMMQKQPDIVVIESTGPGAGVIDQLRARGFKVHEVHPGSAAAEFKRYVNKRTEYHAHMRTWLYEDKPVLENDEDLYEQMTSIEYSLDDGEQRMKLETKKDYSKRTRLSSPDEMDSLALTFAVRVARRDATLGFAAKQRQVATMEADPLA